jgi:hypothetical protein
VTAALRAAILVPARAMITIQAAGPEMAAVAEFIPSASEK